MISKLRKAFSRHRIEKRLREQGALLDAVERNRANPAPYNEHPRTAAILQHFNKRDNVAMIYEGVRASGFDELIFMDDGSSDDSIGAFLALAQGKNEFVIRSNDIFEVRTYDRAIAYSRAEFVFLLQDDDAPPSDPEWVKEVLARFDADPKLAIIGGREGLRFKRNATGPRGLDYEVIEPAKGAPMQYVEAVNRSPMIIRKAAWRELGGIDQAFAPFQCDDVDLCLKAWQAGLKVGLMHTDFIRDIGIGGMRLFNADKFSGQAEKNWAIIRERYESPINAGWFAEQVERARG